MAVSCQAFEQPVGFSSETQRVSLDLQWVDSETTNDSGNLVDADSLGVSVAYGNFVSDSVEVGVEWAFFDDEVQAAGQTIASDGNLLGAFGRYYFANDQATRPFVELGFGAGTADAGSSDADFFYGKAGIGAMQVLSDHVGLEYALTYIYQDVETDADDFEQEDVALTVGFTVFW